MPRMKHRLNAVDTNIGERIRLRRTILGWSQTELGNKVGLSFQQIQKYERGANRVSASFLVELAEILDVPVTFFFDGVGDTLTKDIPDDRSFLTVARYFKAADPSVMDAVISLLAAMSGERRGRGVHPLEITVVQEPVEPARVPEPEPEPVLEETDDAPDHTTRKARRRRGAVWHPNDIKA